MRFLFKVILFVEDDPQRLAAAGVALVLLKRDDLDPAAKPEIFEEGVDFTLFDRAPVYLDASGKRFRVSTPLIQAAQAGGLVTMLGRVCPDAVVFDRGMAMDAEGRVLAGAVALPATSGYAELSAALGALGLTPAPAPKEGVV